MPCTAKGLKSPSKRTGRSLFSPKAGSDLAVTGGDELKVVVPQPGQDLADYESLAFTHFYVQPMDGANRVQNVKIAIDTCLQNPKWKLSLQTHKYLQIP